MSSFENIPDKTRNVNAEWAILKETASSGNLYSNPELEMDSTEREKCRRRGKMLLKIVDRLPDKPDHDEKIAKLDKIYHAAERAGIKDVLDDALTIKRKSLSFEKIGADTFGENAELTPEETAQVEKLRSKVVDMTEAAPGALAEAFPSGNYLYHGSTVPKIEKIFKTGGLKNGVALVEDDPEVNAFALNSGFEGISWSMNEVEALPGSRGHVAGFLAAPENLLEDTQLVIPSRPAPYEVLQVSKTVNPEELYSIKNQLETWGDGGITLNEKNSVDSNLMWMLMYQKDDTFRGRSAIYDYQGDLSSAELHQYYTQDENGNLIWDNDVYQKFEIPPALPWIQSLIDRDIFAKNGFDGLDTVEKVVDYAKNNQDFIKTLVATERNAARPIKEQYEKLLDDGAEAIRIGIGQMYFVTSHQDLDSWLKVMARTGAEPKGILLYDDDQVVLENFVSQYEGDHQELSQEIGQTVAVNKNFWTEEMDMNPGSIPRSGYRQHVLLESAVKHDKVIQLNEQGELTVKAL